MKKYALTANVEDLLIRLMNDQNIALKKSKTLAKNILQLSTNYQNQLQDHSSIWTNTAFVSAYLTYFLPLNILRLSSAIEEAKKYLEFELINHIYDYGSGPGTAQLSFTNTNTPFKNFIGLDTSQIALDIYSSWASKTQLIKSTQVTGKINSDSLAIFSYSLNEMDKIPQQVFEHDNILIIEPSNRKLARRLQKMRDLFLEKKYNILAPCTHHDTCPLLKNSQKDWCHHRIPIELPQWLKNIEKDLPIKNKTLTFSYLLVSKNNQLFSQNKVRVIGDIQKEKGKFKQAICRNDSREFLTWLKRDKLKLSLDRGSVIELNKESSPTHNEVRITSTDDFITKH